jgi:stress response protein YsnF
MNQTQSDRDDERQVVSVIEEHVTVTKEIVETGKVNIHKTVSEETTSVNLPIINETYDIQRMNGNAEILSTPPAPVRYEGDKIIISVIKEVPVVVKRYQLIEEIHLTKKITEIPLTQEVLLRKEQATIKKTTFNNQ